MISRLGPDVPMLRKYYLRKIIELLCQHISFSYSYSFRNHYKSQLNATNTFLRIKNPHSRLRKRPTSFTK